VYVDVALSDGAVTVVPSGYLHPVTPPKTPRRSPLTLTADKDNRTEAEKQRECLEWLQDKGYEVLVVGQYKKRVQCPNCKEWHWPDGGYGNTPGYPDLSISHPSHWATPGRRRPALLIEMKRNAKEPERTPAQLRLASLGISGIVWSLAMMLTEVYEFERDWVQAGPHPEVSAWLQRHNCLPETGQHARLLDLQDELAKARGERE
jgi:hypothetical protein